MPRGLTKTTRRVVEDCLQLSINALPPGRGRIVWQQGGETIASVDYERTDTQLRIPAQPLSLRPPRSIDAHEFTILLVHKFFLLRCVCGRNARCLYLPVDERVFRCRRCHYLIHRSAQTHIKDEYLMAKHPEKIAAGLASPRQSTRLLAARALIRRMMWEEGHCTERVAKQLRQGTPVA